MKYGVCTVKRGNSTAINYFGGCRSEEERHRGTVCGAIENALRAICVLALFTVLIMAAVGLMAVC